MSSGMAAAPCKDATILRVDRGDAEDGVRCVASTAAEAGLAGAGLARVALSMNGGYDIDDTGAKYEFYAAAPATLTPASGPVTGGTRITIGGSGFAVAALAPALTRCLFRVAPDLAAPTVLGAPTELAVTSLSDSAIGCAPIPPCPCADVALGCNATMTLTRNGVDTEAELSYFCFPAPSVARLTPAYGPVGGGKQK